MPAARLSPLDVSFLEVESPSAHMHVGWAALLDPPEGGPPPSFEQLRDHISRRLWRAPRYRQRLASVPLGLAPPEWVDDEAFDLDHHVRRAESDDLDELTARVMSTQLSRERPLWELWIADRLADGRIGLVGKAHHCMVDGIAAVELGSLLLDDRPDPPRERRRRWRPRPAPGPARRLLDAGRERAGEAVGLATLPARLALSPGRALDLARSAERAGRALAHSLSPATHIGGMNEPLSPYRRLARVSRSLDDFRAVKRAYGTTVNDVVLSVAAGGVRRFLERRGREVPRLKAMVPVNVRAGGAEGELGNRISFMFLELPCDEPDPVRRLVDIHAVTSARREEGEPEGGQAVLELVSHAPSLVQRTMSRLVASPRTFNLVVSNIPGPPVPMWLLGCRLREVYPVVPLADRHALSIGFTSVDGGAFFGIYADPDLVPDADLLADDLERSLEELLKRAAEAAPVA